MIYSDFGGEIWSDEIFCLDFGTCEIDSLAKLYSGYNGISISLVDGRELSAKREEQMDQDSLSGDRHQHRQGNVRIRELLTEQDCDLTQERSITNVFYAAEKSSLTAVRDELIRKGLSPAEGEPARAANETDEWCLEVLIDLVPSVETLDRMTDICVDAASVNSAEYDGWYTEVKQ